MERWCCPRCGLDVDVLGAIEVGHLCRNAPIGKKFVHLIKQPAEVGERRAS